MEVEMDEDDLMPLRRKPQPKDLNPMSIEELEGYIAGMEAEISRAREAIAAKKAQRGGAESLFKR